MPSLTFEKENNRPIAVIRSDNKDLDKKLIYLDDLPKNGIREIDLSDKTTIFPVFKHVGKEKQNFRIGIFAKSGAGKSTVAGKVLDVMMKYNDNEKRIAILSPIDEDAPLDVERGKDKELPIRIDINDPEVLSLTAADFENCVVVFDDIESSENYPIIAKLRNSILETGRHYKTDIVVISHNILGGKNTKVVHSESTANFIFPRYSQFHHINTFLKEYSGMKKSDIDRVLKLESRWVYVSNTAPAYIIYEHGVYLL